MHPFNAYGGKRDALIARAKVVLNIHYYAAQVFEIVRVSYLLANSKAVVTEIGPDTDLDETERRRRRRALQRDADAALALVRDDDAAMPGDARLRGLQQAREAAMLDAALAQMCCG